jgi:hypothetical protein
VNRLTINVEQLIAGLQSCVFPRPLGTYTLGIELAVALKPPHTIIRNNVLTFFLKVDRAKDNTGDCA